MDAKFSGGFADRRKMRIRLRPVDWQGGAAFIRKYQTAKGIIPELGSGLLWTRTNVGAVGGDSRGDPDVG